MYLLPIPVLMVVTENGCAEIPNLALAHGVLSEDWVFTRVCIRRTDTPSVDRAKLGVVRLDRTQDASAPLQRHLMERPSNQHGTIVVRPLIRRHINVILPRCGLAANPDPIQRLPIHLRNRTDHEESSARLDVAAQPHL